ncbi:MAG: 3-phosphoserine/phosphohydroxythreonine transaminase [Planctomycetes bacterium]|nr:3-phosphoserine/phosphohydroxythreonine transaminase [Planctomycetota bacterium]
MSSATTQATDRVYNFSPGPAVMPLSVLEQIQKDLVALPGSGASILEISHRGKPFLAILEDAKRRLRDLLRIPSNYHILFLQGGARLQFSMVPMNLLRGASAPASYVLTGSWGIKALEEARREGPTHVAWDGRDTAYDGVPAWTGVPIPSDAAYVHMTSNETIEGVQFRDAPPAGLPPVVCDCSSDFLSRPIPVDRYALLYACAQKNAGPAGVTIVIVRDDLLERCGDSLPGYLNYRNHVEEDSLYNTPATFGIYVFGLIARWLEEEVGGLDAMRLRNERKARMVYDAIDESRGFYRGHARPEHRSAMNATFRLPDESREKAFLGEAEKIGLCSLKGHRSVGGIRASIYNAMPDEGVEQLCGFMRGFARRHGGGA